jgi:flagellin-like protein
MQRKGISPIIASVLLLAVSLAVVGIFSGWAPELATQVTDSTENTTMQTITCNDAAIEVQSAYHDGSELKISVRNTGTEDLSNLTFVAYNDNEQIINENTSNSLVRGAVEDFTISSVSSEPNYVEGFSTECGSVTSRLDDINT